MTSNDLHKMLLDNLSTAVLLLDGDFLIDYINPAAEALLQASSGRLLGTPASELFSDHELSYQTLVEVMDTGHPHIRRHEHLRILGSDSIQVDYTITPVDSADCRQLLLEMQPIDRFLKINREEALLSVHNTSKSLIRGLAHEIKNPLGGIRGAAQLLEQQLRDDGLGGETLEFCQVIITETDRLRNLVDRLLGPNHLPRLEPINIHEVTEHVGALIEAEVQGNLTLVRDYDPSIPTINGDREQLIQAVLNVVRNAMQSLIDAKSCAPSITLTTRIRRSFTIAGQYHKVVCRLEVKDNGPGVSKDLKERIFFPMISGRAGGSGLGLTIAQTAVNGHQGIIECESEPGNTRFSMYLPIKV